jgi:glycosyltransferase involved in cell wall biosynthesis
MADYAVLLPVLAEFPYPSDAILAFVNDLLSQTVPPSALFVVRQGEKEGLVRQIVEKAREKRCSVSLVEGQSTLAEGLNRALEQVPTSHFLLPFLDRAPLRLKKSAADVFCWAAERHPDAGLFYADYERVTPDGIQDVHLLEYHPGRVRDNLDLGYVFFVRTQVAREIGGFDPRYPHGMLYDFRLRVSEKAELKLIGNRYGGGLYQILSTGKKHDVFDYLLSSKEVQLEMEAIVTEHLKRIGAYLAPGGYSRLTFSPEEEKAYEFQASVIIPVNHRPQFIGKAIESVQQQTERSVEVIVVVNGGPDDPTIREVQRYMEGGDRFRKDAPPVRLLVHDVNNIGLCLNSGVRAAKGKYYVQLDSDDRLKPDAVEKILACFASDPHIGMVIGSYEVWQLEDDGRYFRRPDIPVVTHDEWTEENGRNNLLRVNGAGAPRAIPVKVIREMGWFSVNDSPYSRNYGEDYEMVLKISEKYRIGRIWEPIYEVVRHSGGTDHAIDQITIDRNDNAKDWMRLEAIRRRQRLNRQKAAG